MNATLGSCRVLRPKVTKYRLGAYGGVPCNLSAFELLMPEVVSELDPEQLR